MNHGEDLKPLESALKWAGGKGWLVPRLRALYHAHRHRRLVEPFCGALNVAFGLRPEHALLTDVNANLINFHQRVRDGLTIEWPMLNDEALYYGLRDQFNLVQVKILNPVRHAQILYYLNRTCYNGLYRENRKGEFNVPFGSYKRINYRTDFTELTEAMKGWVIYRTDFRSLRLDPFDFLYLDPPYDVPFTKYSAGGFDWNDQMALAVWADKHQGPIVASNQATERVLTMYERLGFKIETMPAPRKMSCTGDRTPALEMLATRGL